VPASPAQGGHPEGDDADGAEHDLDGARQSHEGTLTDVLEARPRPPGRQGEERGDERRGGRNAEQLGRDREVGPPDDPVREDDHVGPQSRNDDGPAEGGAVVSGGTSAQALNGTSRRPWW